MYVCVISGFILFTGKKLPKPTNLSLTQFDNATTIQVKWNITLPKDGSGAVRLYADID